MIDAELIIARLKSTGLFRVVGGAAQGSAALQAQGGIGDGPNAYVLPMGDKAGHPISLNDVAQQVTSTFGIALMVRAAGDALGNMTMDRMQALQAQLQASLVGWRPGDDWSPVFYGGGSLLAFGTGIMWWMEEMHVVTGIETQPQAYS